MQKIIKKKNKEIIFFSLSDTAKEAEDFFMTYYVCTDIVLYIYKDKFVSTYKYMCKQTN